jgi:adenosylcobinamide kinase/adenosylcobinamide-phosphate guanylyltransferase
MTCFISGGAKNGKSTLAQDLAVALAGGGRLYYVATMISTGSEDDDRIRRHIVNRDGMGFETVECFRNILDCLQTADKDGVFLVDSVTALIQNSLFPIENNYAMDLEAASRCADELVAFAHTVHHAVFVSDYIYSDAQRYSESTEMYRKCLADIDRRLAAVCDTVIEVSAGQPVIHKSCHCEPVRTLVWQSPSKEEIATSLRSSQ